MTKTTEETTDDETDPWGGTTQYRCEWCDSLQLVPAEVENRRYEDMPLNAGRRWICIACYESDDEPWTDEWTQYRAAVRRVA